MITILDAKAELAKLRMLRGRTPETPAAAREGAFARVDGATILHIMEEDGPQSFALSTGMVAIVPKGIWHRFEAPDGVSLVTATPQPTEHLTVAVDDPRTLG